jgi:TolB protein
MPRAGVIHAWPIFSMHKIFRFFFAALLISAPAFAASNSAIVVGVTGKIPVRITASSPELQGLVYKAFLTHGLYEPVASGQSYDFKFTAVGANQVRLDIGGRATFSQTVSGRTLNQALLRAADVAVEQTNGKKLRGFFTARLAFISEKTGRSEVFVSDLFLNEAK